MNFEVDILENDVLANYPNVLETLLIDQTTQKNIIWATDNYNDLGKEYNFSSHILPLLITGENGFIVMPRVKKEKDIQLTRSRDMAEIFTPSWICNTQNNLIDSEWFGDKNIFNTEKIKEDGTISWEINLKKIKFPKTKDWKEYVRDKRLEMACGEAPYIASRYDTTNGKFIPVEKRIGILDRKIRVINENVHNIKEWNEETQAAYKNTYAFEWQGDSLLLARESLLFTFIENFSLKFGKSPSVKSIQIIAEIISWNIWQMDGVKGIIPNSCGSKIIENKTLFGETEKSIVSCEGCLKENIHKHNGVYCFIKEWNDNDLNLGPKENKIKFVDLLKNI